MGRMLLTIQQTGSPIRTNKRRKKIEQTLRGLQLGRIGRTIQVPDTREIRGMLAEVRHIVQVIYLQIDIRQFGKEVRAEYRDLVLGRIVRGEVLWNRFESALARCLADPDSNDRELTECVNELAAAKVLANDKSLEGRPIEYEPNFLPGGRRIDFLVDRGADNLYVEVKTVRPKTVDSDAAWEKFVRLKKRHPKNVNYIVTREGMGGAIHGNEYASRAHFLDYSLAFETRLASAKTIKQGPGVLIFCGNGFAWRLTNLEDFADFYRTGVHRADDAFGPMEEHHIKENGIHLERNIDHFAFLRRPVDEAPFQEMYFPVRGPRFGMTPN